MNFNHLLEKKELLINCKTRNTSICKWKPTGNIKASAGSNVCVSLVCERCLARTDVFMSETKYKMHESVILKEVENV